MSRSSLRTVLGSVSDVVGDLVVIHHGPTARVRRRVRHRCLAWAVLPLLAACTDGSSATPGDTTAISVKWSAPPTFPPAAATTVPPTTLLATTTTTAAATTSTTAASNTQYGAYTVQADLSLSPTPTELHQELWDLFRRVLGDAAAAQYIETFTVYYDQYRNVDATVLDGQTPGKRQVLVNARYADDLNALTRTFIHEYGHIVTLSGDQVTASVDCGTTSVDEGCLAADSYLNGFLDRFWWSYGQEVFDALASPTAMDAFYAAHQTDFVTRYAATDPLEDIAETWAEFVIRDAPPAGATVAEQKILFLYAFPALVELREQIRARVGVLVV